MRRLLAILALLALPAHADEAGDFDYYVLAMSWSPTWCALEGEARDADQCDRDLGWVLHGLWPQYETGWPQYCNTSRRDPSRAETAAMSDIMGDGGAAWYQWKKHGRCADLPPQDYFANARAAFQAIEKPDPLDALADPVRLPARVVEQAFLQQNPALFADAITITCKSGRIQEARICLDRDDMQPRRCGKDVIRDCTMTDALLDPIR